MSSSHQVVEAADMPDRLPQARIALGGWNFYFIAKLLLFWREIIGFHAAPNLIFALFLLLPRERVLWRRLRLVLAFPLAIALLYHDSWLPSIGRVLSQASLLANFDAAYLSELAGRFISVPLLLAFAVTVLAYRMLAPWVRFGLPVMGVMLVLLLMPQTQPVAIAQSGDAEGASQQDPQLAFDAMLKTFYQNERTRHVAFRLPPSDAPPFDIIFVHVCSLSWDDVLAMGLENHPLWQRFDFLFTQFNSAASYSGPAAIRINRATCGQTSNARLYEPVSDSCYLFGSLARSGFQTQLAMNHDGHFDDFLQLVQSQRVSVPPLPLEGIPVTQHAFDGAPIYDDRKVLSHWLAQREQSDAARVALYYNTISLHDGNRVVGADATRDSLETYKLRLKMLLDGLEQFMDELDRSGRRAVVAMIPEHGAAVRGDKMQIPGLREIPSPKITLVPVGVKVIGEGAKRQGEAVKIEDETSFLAVTELLSRMLETPPYEAQGFNPAEYASKLPLTPYVAQNDTAVVMRHNGRYYLKIENEPWQEYN